MNELKEVFRQREYDGIPEHWVVQYYQDKYLYAEYFATEEEAMKFVDDEIYYHETV